MLWNIGEAVEQEEKLHDEVSEFTYFGDRVSACGGCEAAVSARKRCWWVKFRECGDLLYGRRFPLRLNVVVYELCKSTNTVWKWSMVPEEKWDGNCAIDRENHGESNVWSTSQIQKQIYGFDVHVWFEWNNGSDGYGKQCSLVWACVDEGGCSHLENGIGSWGWRSEEEREAEERKQVEEESVMVGLRREDELCRSTSSAGVKQIAAW